MILRTNYLKLLRVSAVSLSIILTMTSASGAGLSCQKLFKTESTSKKSKFVDLEKRQRVFSFQKIKTVPATGQYFHQVAGIKAIAFDKKSWFKNMKSIFSMNPSRIIKVLQEEWIPTSFQNVIWTTKGRVYIQTDKENFQVKMKFKKDYLFVDMNTLDSLVHVWKLYRNRSIGYPIDLIRDGDFLAEYRIAGIYDPVNNFYKIAGLAGLSVIEVEDPQGNFESNHVDF
jgi:hypothetical protein